MATNTQTQLAFGLLGPLEVVGEGQLSLPLGSPKQRALLALLLVHRGAVVSRERLIDELWGERAPAAATASLQVYVHGLRKLLGAERIVRQGAGYRLAVESGEVDLNRFEQLVASARGVRRDDAARAAGLLRDALALWRGAALADVGAAPFAEREASRLEELRVGAVEARIEADLALGRSHELVAELDALTSQHPFRERLWGQLMLALYRAGRQAEALEAYQRARRVLVDDLGIEPGPELRELERAILAQDASVAGSAAAPAAGAPLPAPPTPLIGRTRELGEVAALLAAPGVRLVTLTGPGGAGKTRLALAVAGAEEARERVLVDLSPLARVELVPSALADALGVPESPGRPLADAVADHLASRWLLLVVDNVEHLTDAAPLLAELLRRAPGLQLLVTSRVRLQLAGEHEYVVPPLDEGDAVALFSARARAADAGFRLDDANAATVTAVCRALDGLPLAIELAAARAKLLPPEALLRRLGAPLDLVAAGGPDRPPRQRSLRATLDASHDLLDDEQRRVLAWLAAFSGGFRIDDAEAVCGPGSVDTLAALLDQSLLVRRPDQAGEPRLGLLETVRAYALERLANRPEADEVQRRHAERYAELADALDLGGVGDAERLARVDAERHNMRAAIDWSAAVGERDLELRLCAHLRHYWGVRGYPGEGRAALESALARDHGPADGLRAEALRTLGVLAFKQADYDRARVVWDEALTIYHTSGDAVGAARLLYLQGSLLGAIGELDAGIARLRAAADLYRQQEDLARLSAALANMAVLASTSGDDVQARALLDEALAVAGRADNPWSELIARCNLGRVALRVGDLDDAGPHLQRALHLAGGIGSPQITAHTLEALGELAAARGDLERAATLIGAGEAGLEAVGVPLEPLERKMHEQTLELLRDRLGSGALQRLRGAGRDLPVDRAIADARQVV